MPWRPSRAREIASDAAEPFPSTPLLWGPFLKNPSPGALWRCRFGSFAMTATITRNPRLRRSTSTAATPAAAAAAAASRFTRIGALFQGREQGEFQLRLETGFLAALGYPIADGQQATLILKQRQSRNGLAYRSVFLAIEDA